jgi:hypothetical protein
VLQCTAGAEPRAAAHGRARGAQGKAHGNAEVLRCLVRGYAGLAEGCQREMSRAVRLALWDFQKGAALTGVCDADVGSVCQVRRAGARRPGGAVMRASCLQG